MTIVFDQLTADVTAAITEMQALVTQIQPQIAGTSDTQLQTLVTQLEAATAAAKASVTPPFVTPTA
jgi:hypothetical protein